VMRGLVSEMGLKARDLFQPVRIALTGSRHSPGLFEVMTLLGKKKTLARLATARKQFA
jgi:glutamyl-tRNA synthetase